MHQPPDRLTKCPRLKTTAFAFEQKKVKTKGKNSIEDGIEKERRLFARFKGVSKEELLARTLPDRLKENLDIIFVGKKQKRLVMVWYGYGMPLRYKTKD